MSPAAWWLLGAGYTAGGVWGLTHNLRQIREERNREHWAKVREIWPGAVVAVPAFSFLLWPMVVLFVWLAHREESSEESGEGGPGGS